MTDVDETENVWMKAARAKLHRINGREKGEQLLREGLDSLGLTELRSADDLHHLADYFVARGGFAEAIGYALRFQAALYGASGTVTK